MKQSLEILQQKGIRATPNRELVLDVLIRSVGPQSIASIEDELETVDRSSIFRVLNLFAESGMLHEIEDGSGSLKYELCHSDGECSVDDMHVHFFCEVCHKTTCLESQHIPPVILPAGYTVKSANYILKGICPECNGKSR